MLTMSTQVEKISLKQSKLKDIHAITKSFVCVACINYSSELIQWEKIARFNFTRALIKLTNQSKWRNFDFNIDPYVYRFDNKNSIFFSAKIGNIIIITFWSP